MNWKPYPQERPGKGMSCLVTIENENGRLVCEAVYFNHSDGDGYFMFCNDDEWVVMTDVIAWMRYPRPYDPSNKAEDNPVYMVMSDYYLVGVYRKRSDAIDEIGKTLGGLSTDEVERQLKKLGYCIGYDAFYNEKTSVWLEERFVE